MKLAIAVFVIYLAIVACHGSKLELKSPIESPRYREIMEQLYPKLSDEGTGRTGRITNGIRAELGQFPHQVYMYIYESSGAGYLCGGSVND